MGVRRRAKTVNSAVLLMFGTLTPAINELLTLLPVITVRMYGKVGYNLHELMGMLTITYLHSFVIHLLGTRADYLIFSEPPFNNFNNSSVNIAV